MNPHSLCTNIPNKEGIKAFKRTPNNFICDKVFTNGPRKICGRQPLKNFLKAVFHKFYLVHSRILCHICNCQRYLQIKVCAMGTKPALMGSFVEKCMHPLIQNITLLYLRFRADNFLI